MNVAVTGAPGVGKTTAVRRAAMLLSSILPVGFYTEEVRDEDGERIGFDIVTLDGKRGILARKGPTALPRVGKYVVDVEAFEELALPVLRLKSRLYLVDEIGRMECFSPAFVERVREILFSPAHLLATVGLRGEGFLAEVRRRKDIIFLTATAENREALPRQLAGFFA
ncbi:MAG: nucleoside-triphosphatase [Planctomycetota bacterium]